MQGGRSSDRCEADDRGSQTRRTASFLRLPCGGNTGIYQRTSTVRKMLRLYFLEMLAFFSGAKDFLGHVKEQEENLEVRVIPGIFVSCLFLCEAACPMGKKVKSDQCPRGERKDWFPVYGNILWFLHWQEERIRLQNFCKRLTAYGFWRL
mgnify:CR=1 FL=1